MVHTLFSLITQPTAAQETHQNRTRVGKQHPPATELLSYHVENIPKVHKEQQLRMNLELKSMHCSAQQLNPTF